MPHNDMKRVVDYMRSMVARELDRRTFSGTEVPADPANGRFARYWVHGEDVVRADGSQAPVVVVLHGGGFALGDARKGDALREWIAQRFEARAIGVDYRLAPENPAPCALDDVVAAIRYVSNRFADNEALPPSVYLMGFSAGANLALAAALELQGSSDVSLGGLALHYPMVDSSDKTPEENDTEGLPHELMAAFTRWYAAGRDLKDIKISPALAPDDALRHLPPVTIYPVLGDSLFGQAERLRDRLVSLGCPVSWHPVAGMYHGYAEDAEDMDLYRATTAPITMKGRPTDFVNVAARELDASLVELLGPARNDVVFPSLEKGDGTE